MSHVYIVRAGWEKGLTSQHYEGSEILMVFASFSDATRFLSEYPRQADGRPEGYDYITMSRHNIFPASEEL
jgi:hypothetical protein